MIDYMKALYLSEWEPSTAVATAPCRFVDPMFGAFRTLRLDNNKLSGLPESLQTLTSPTSLSLRHNNFSKLPYLFGELRSLQNLDLGENILNTLPATMVSGPLHQCVFLTSQMTVTQIDITSSLTKTAAVGGMCVRG